LGIVQSFSTEEIIIVSPTYSQWFYIKDGAVVTVESHATVHAVVALAHTGSASTLQPTVHNVRGPSQTILTICTDIGGTTLLFAGEDIVRRWFAPLAASRVAGASGEPKPHAAGPSQFRVGSNPIGIVEKNVLVSTIFFGKLSIIVVPRELFWTTAAVALSGHTRVQTTGRTIGTASLKYFAETPSRAATVGLVVTP